MRIGVQLAQLGRLADARAVRRSAMAAEQVGFDSIWVLDRLVAPLAPRSPYPGTPDGSLPDGMATSLDPLAVLAYAAAVTERVRLGASVLVAPWYRPVPLARQLTSLDVLSEGRLSIGLGVGWSLDEYDAAGVPMAERGRRLDEVLDVLDAYWGPDPTVHESENVRIVPARVRPKPTQQPRPPLLLAARAEAGFDRVARRADGWNPVGLPVDVLATVWKQIRDAAAGYGRDPDALQLVVRADIALLDEPAGDDRPTYVGDVAQVADDLAATAEAGASEVIIGFHGDVHLDDALDRIARVAEALDDRIGRFSR